MTTPALQASALFDVRGRVCLVTGGASGIGLACAEVLAANGAQLHIIDRDQAAIDAALAAWRAAGAQCSGHLADVADAAQIGAAVDAVQQTAGRIDVAFVNAGIGGGPGFLRGDGSRNTDRLFEKLPLEQWNAVMQVNVTGALLTMQNVARVMKQAGRGRIVVTSSVSATKTEHLVGTPYVVSKAAVTQLVRQAALELAAYGITVNALAPGPFITNISGGRLRQPDARAPFEALIPMHRLGDKPDIQGVALFLASDAARYMTGASVAVDGGFSLGTTDNP